MTSVVQTRPLVFAAIGAAHPHVYGQVDALLKAGARLKWFYDETPAACVEFNARYAGVTVARQTEEILADAEVRLIVGTVPHDQRAALGIRAMKHGKDYLCAKPGFTTVEQLETAIQVQRETQRIYSVYFSERFSNAATVKALELVRSGRIGQVIQTVGFGPHRLLQGSPRPAWWFDTARHGGILNDLASHQIDQFMTFSGSTHGEVMSAHVGNAKFHQYPAFEDFGDVLLRSDRAIGYVRVDWLTADGLPTWGDVRLFVLGTEGTIEIRKNTDLDGQAGGNHLFVVDGLGVERVSCTEVELPFARQLIADIDDRTETAMTQDHCFRVCRLALHAQEQAVWLTFAPKNA